MPGPSAPTTTIAIIPDLSAGGGKVLRATSVSLEPQATIDLGDNAMIVDWTSTSPISTIAACIQSAYAGGNWSGAGITSSSAEFAKNAIHKTALGFGEASAILGPTGGMFRGQNVDATTALIAYTYYGDANLDGTVNALDFNALATNYGKNAGSDSITCGNGDDTATGGNGADCVYGNKGNDQLSGGDDGSRDTVEGNDGADVLFGQNVIDVYFGGSGVNDPQDVILA